MLHVDDWALFNESFPIFEQYILSRTYTSQCTSFSNWTPSFLHVIWSLIGFISCINLEWADDNVAKSVVLIYRRYQYTVKIHFNNQVIIF